MRERCKREWRCDSDELALPSVRKMEPLPFLTDDESDGSASARDAVAAARPPRQRPRHADRD